MNIMTEDNIKIIGYKIHWIVNREYCKWDNFLNKMVTLFETSPNVSR